MSEINKLGMVLEVGVEPAPGTENSQVTDSTGSSKADSALGTDGQVQTRYKNGRRGRGNSAIFSPCRTFRYALTRDVNPLVGRGTVNMIMLNPSTADESANDPTIERCVRRTARLGYGRYVATNLFAYRSTNPKNLKKVDDPIGPDNDWWIVEEALTAQLVIAAWGPKGALHDRAKRVLCMLWDECVEVHYLRLTKENYPEHPLYIPYSEEPKPLYPSQATFYPSPTPEEDDASE